MYRFPVVVFFWSEDEIAPAVGHDGTATNTRLQSDVDRIWIKPPATDPIRPLTGVCRHSLRTSAQ